MKVLILCNSSIGLYKFRKELIEKLLKENYEIYISCPKEKYFDYFINIGCCVINTKIDRRGKNFFTDFFLLKEYFRLIKKLNPCIVLTYTIKPNIYGGLVCKLLKKPYLSNITGLGSSIVCKDSFLKKFSLFLYRLGINSARCIFFQNENNKSFFEKTLKLNNKMILLPGSGVNLLEYKFIKYPQQEKTLNFLFIGRIMKDKGILDLLKAAKKIKNKYDSVKFIIIGDCEEEYFSLLKYYEIEGIINYYPFQENIKQYIEKSHCTILPSYHEGMSNVLLESAACGRPIIATNISGCKEIIDDNENGFLCNPNDVASLYLAIEMFISTPYIKKIKMGENSRKKVEKDFDRNIIINYYLSEIKKIGENKINDLL